MWKKLLFFQRPRRTRRILRTGILYSTVVAAVLGGPCPGRAQVLHVETLPGGTELVLVAQAEATASAVAWPERDATNRVVIRSVESGQLSLASDLASALGSTTHRPPVVVAVGAAARDELVGALQGLLGGGPEARAATAKPAASMDEGGVERRLGGPGSRAVLRLKLPLPPLSDERRAGVEVLVETVPVLLRRRFPGLRATQGPDAATFELQVEPAAGDLQLRRLRRSLAGLGENTGLDAATVDRARRRLQVARLASLEQLGQGARRLVSIWLAGGDEGVRQFLFGVNGAGLGAVRRAASTWLARHPGWATIILPPQSLNPRFAGGPESEVLDNGLSVVLLERPATPLTVLCLRPVMTPDLAGERTATVLTRLAGELRRSETPPAWIRVSSQPPALLLAAGPDGFAEALEALTEGLRELGADTSALPESRDPRHLALGLMGRLLGVDRGDLVPAELLAPANLALGAVVPDAERATEALHKLMDGLAGSSTTVAVDLEGTFRRVAPLPGPASAVAVELPVDEATDEAVLRLTEAVLDSRVRAAFGPQAAQVLRPAVPGRKVLVVVVTGKGTVDVVRSALAAAWTSLVGPPAAAELEPIRHRVASEIATGGSGTVGAAARCARLAAVGGSWRRVDEMERSVLSTDPAAVASVLAELPPWDRLSTTAAGPLPLGSLDLPAR